MSMDHEHILRHPLCVGCDESVDINDPALGYEVDNDGEYWHATCYALEQSERDGDREPDSDSYFTTRYEDSQSYRDDMNNSGRGHLLP